MYTDPTIRPEDPFKKKTAVTENIAQAPDEGVVDDARDDSAGNTEVDHSPTTSGTTAPASSIDPVKREELTQLFLATLDNPRFWAKDTRVEALKNALVIPVFDDRALQQFFNHAMDDLIAKAALHSSQSGQPAIMPTEEQAKTLAWERYAIKRKKELKRAHKEKDHKPSDVDLNKEVQQEIAELKLKENAV